MTQIETKRERGFYAMVPRMVIKDTRLTHAEKTFYMCLKDMCGDTATCFRSMRTLAEETGISPSSLSKMIPHLQQLGYIQGEKKARGYGGPPVWHISLVDIWEENTKYCAKNVQLPQVDESVVQNLGSVVQEMNKDTESCANFVESCANFTDRRRYSEEEYKKEEGEEENIPLETPSEYKTDEPPESQNPPRAPISDPEKKTPPAWIEHLPKVRSTQYKMPDTLFVQPKEVPEPKPLTKNEQRYLNEQERAAIWKVIEDVFHTSFPYGVRTQIFNTRGMDALIEDHFTPDDVKKALTGMEPFHRNNLKANFTLEKLHLKMPGLLAAKEEVAPPSKPAAHSSRPLDIAPQPGGWGRRLDGAMMPGAGRVRHD